MLELEELARAMRGFPHGNDLRIPDHPLKRKQIVQRTIGICAVQGYGLAAEPLADLFWNRGWFFRAGG